MPTHKDHHLLPTPVSPANDNKFYSVEIDANGTQFWRAFCNTVDCETALHRLDGPTVIFKSSHRIWCKDGLKHRDQSQADQSGSGTFYPAVITAGGCLEYWQEGKLHCTTGPAIRSPKYPAEDCWYLDGKEYSYVEWLTETKRRYQAAQLIASTPHKDTEALDDVAGTIVTVGTKSYKLVSV